MCPGKPLHIECVTAKSCTEPGNGGLHKKQLPPPLGGGSCLSHDFHMGENHTTGSAPQPDYPRVLELLEQQQAHRQQDHPAHT